MSSPTNDASDNPLADDVETESLYGAAPDGSSQDPADDDGTDDDDSGLDGTGPDAAEAAPRD